LLQIVFIETEILILIINFLNQFNSKVYIQSAFLAFKTL
jgi:hypothetical protein